ncbi:MAG: type II toxin-antitoxin system VapB family antitoxin [Gammaproteobacteria bacterium]|nr:type II toxin-antitoxin system VapB family antitoxin [Gammaproteobacteria bacterium]
MRINIDLDDTLMDNAVASTGIQDKDALVHLALTELVRSRRKKNLLDLAGKLNLRPDYDHKELRRLRNDFD